MARHANIETTMLYYHELDRLAYPAEDLISYCRPAASRPNAGRLPAALARPGAAGKTHPGPEPTDGRIAGGGWAGGVTKSRFSPLEASYLPPPFRTDFMDVVGNLVKTTIGETFCHLECVSIMG